jgi:hypothetical protein
MESIDVFISVLLFDGSIVIADPAYGGTEPFQSDASTSRRTLVLVRLLRAVDEGSAHRDFGVIQKDNE